MAIIAFPRLIFPIAAGSEAAAIAAANIAENPAEIIDMGSGSYELRLACYPDTYRAPSYFSSSGVLGFNSVFVTSNFQVGEIELNYPGSIAVKDILDSLNTSAEGFLCQDENAGKAGQPHLEMMVKLKESITTTGIVINIPGWGRRAYQALKIMLLDISTLTRLAG